MTHTTGSPYSNFQIAFELGQKEIAEARGMSPEMSAEQLGKVAEIAYRGLIQTDYGQSLVDGGLQHVAESLESGLVTLANKIDFDLDERWKDSLIGVKWALDDPNSQVREFLFWGRLGEIFHYFRDLGGSLCTGTEEDLRRTFRANANAVISNLENLLSHVVVRTVYQDSTISKMESLLKGLKVVRDGFQIQPSELAAGSSNPLQGGVTIIRRQFIRMVSLLGFELYGHMPVKAIATLLEMKSTTAEQLGLMPWPLVAGGRDMTLASRRDEIRRYRKKVIKDALVQATTRCWPTEILIRYAQLHPALLEEVAPD